MRNEGKEEQSRFWIESFGQDALAEGTAFGRFGVGGQFGVARANHFYAEKDQIGGTGILYGAKCDGRRRQDRGDAERGREHVEESAKECAERGLKTFAAAAGKRAGKDVEN